MTVQKDTPQKVPKKRGRKPKGGKIIAINEQSKQYKKMGRENVILRLKCSSKDLHTPSFFSDIKYDPIVQHVQAYDEMVHTDTYKFIQRNEIIQDNVEINLCNSNNNNTDNYKCDYDKPHENVSSNTIWDKIKELQHSFHVNNISDKKSACFWCTYDFENPVIYIPKYKLNNTYEVYGCFCSPECATAFLFNEKITTSFKFERYALLQSLYKTTFQYTENIKPASDPRYTLDKYFGNMTIHEYRQLNKSYNNFMIIDKPITISLPEIYESNDNIHIKSRFNTKLDKNSTTNQYRLTRNTTAPKKTNFFA